MITEAIFGFIFTLITWFFDLVTTFIAPFVIPAEFGDGLGTVFGDIWLLNSFLPIDHVFMALTFAVSWKVGMFAYDAFLYVFAVINLIKKTFFNPFG